MPLLTIGHSNHPIEHFLGRLRRHGVEAVADVRSRPYSRFVPHFGKNQIERRLAEEGIGYLYLGRELGGKPPRGEPASTALDYATRIGEPAFRRGIERLLEAASAQPLALMCRERDPIDCHRLHLICRYVRPTVADLRHILADGAIEMHTATERRLVERTGQGTLPLFEADGDALERAYDQWWERAR